MSSELQPGKTVLAGTGGADRRHTETVFEAESLVLFLAKGRKLSLTHILLSWAPRATWPVYVDYMVSITVSALVATHSLPH